MLAYLEEIKNLFLTYKMVKKIKDSFKNKELYEFIDQYTKDLFNRTNKGIYVDSASEYYVELDSKEGRFSFKMVAPDPQNANYVSLDARYVVPGSESVDVVNLFNIHGNEDEGKIVVEKVFDTIVRNEANKILKMDTTSYNQTFIDNKLRYELKKIKHNNTEVLGQNTQEVTETFIDLDNNAVIRKIFYTVNNNIIEPIDIKYYEVLDYNADDFNNLVKFSIVKQGTKREIDEDQFNDFVYGGNNLSPYL